MTSFWLNDFSVLLNKNDISELWPNKDFSLEKKLNAITRLIFLLTFFGFLITGSVKIIVSALVTLVVLVIIHNTEKKKEINNKKKEGMGNMISKVISKENYTLPSDNNPLMNVLPTDFTNNPNRNRAAPSYEKNIDKQILNKAEKIFKKSVPNKKLFQDLGENLTFQQSMRNFYTNPNTTIPNDQQSFMNFCYGNMPSQKELHKNVKL